MADRSRPAHRPPSGVLACRRRPARTWSRDRHRQSAPCDSPCTCPPVNRLDVRDRGRYDRSSSTGSTPRARACSAMRWRAWVSCLTVRDGLSITSPLLTFVVVVGVGVSVGPSVSRSYVSCSLASPGCAPRRPCWSRRPCPRRPISWSSNPPPSPRPSPFPQPPFLERGGGGAVLPPPRVTPSAFPLQLRCPSDRLGRRFLRPILGSAAGKPQPVVDLDREESPGRVRSPAIEAQASLEPGQPSTATAAPTGSGRRVPRCGEPAEEWSSNPPPSPSPSVCPRPPPGPSASLRPPGIPDDDEILGSPWRTRSTGGTALTHAPRPGARPGRGDGRRRAGPRVRPAAPPRPRPSSNPLPAVRLRAPRLPVRPRPPRRPPRSPGQQSEVRSAEQLGLGGEQSRQHDARRGPRRVDPQALWKSCA